MEDGGQVPPAPDTESDFIGPLPETGLSVSNLFSQLEDTESASPGPDLDFSTVLLDGFLPQTFGYDFDPIETPAWYEDLPQTEEEVQSWFDSRLQVAPEPMVRTVSPSVTQADVDADIERYNQWVVNTNSQIAAAETELKDLFDRAAAFGTQVDENNGKIQSNAKRLNREATQASLLQFVETGDGSKLALNKARIGFNVPGVGLSKRAIMTYSDLWGGEMPSMDSVNEALDNYILENEGSLAEERLKMQDKAYNAAYQKSLSREDLVPMYEVDEEAIRAEAGATFDKIMRENAYRKMLGEKVTELLPDEVKSDPSMITRMETQVYEDLLYDGAAADMAKSLGFGRLSTLINIDDDKVFIGEHRPEVDDQIHALTGVGIPRAKLGLAGAMTVAKDLSEAFMIFGGQQGNTMEQEEQRLADFSESYRQRQSWYVSYLKDIDLKVEEAKRSFNKYAYTRDQVRTLGPLSGYTREEVAGMALDAKVDAINAVEDATTAIGGLVDAREFRMGLESLPNSLVGTGLAFIPYVGLGLSTAYIGAGVYQEEYTRSFDNPLLKNLTDDERAGYAWWKAGGESSGELMGNALFLGLGKFVAGGSKLTSGYILADPLLNRAARMIGGYFMATGLAYPEEWLAESLTEFMQLAADDYAEKLSAGKVNNFSEWHQKFDYHKFFKQHEERIKEAGRIGGAMSFIPAAGVTTISYGRAELGRATGSDAFYEKAIAQIVSGQTFTEELSNADRAELEELVATVGAMSTSERMSPEGQSASERIVELTQKAATLGAKTSEELRGLARVNPDLFIASYQADMQARELEAVGGKYSQDENGRWRLNGRFIGDPTETKAYAKNQRLSDEDKAAIMGRVNKLRAGIRINQRFGAYASGMRTADPSLAARRVKPDQVRENWREKGEFDEITSETDLSNVFADEQTRKMFEAFQSMLLDGESIIVHKENLDSVGQVGDMGLYVEYSDGRKEMHVKGDINDAGYVLAHEFGHRDTEGLLQDPEQRNKHADDIIKKDAEFAAAVFEAYTGMRPTKAALDVEISKLSPEALGAYQRELIVHYLDQAARGNINSVATGVVSGMLTRLGVRAGLVSESSMAAIAANYMQTVRAAGLPTGMKSKKDFAEVQRINEQRRVEDSMTESEFEKAVEDGGNLLASRNVNLFRGGTVYFEFNRNVKIGDYESVERKYNWSQKQFNDYFHFVNFWRQQTGNGSRETIRDIYFIADGVHVPIVPTDKWIKKDRETGEPVRMQGARTYQQMQADRFMRNEALDDEFLSQRSELFDEISEIWRNNFKFKGFSLDIQSFWEPGLDPHSMAGRVATKKNMLGLLDQGITEEQFRDMIGERQYLITRKTNPELFSLGGNVPYETFTQAAERTTNEALEFGVQPWELLPEGSQGYKQRVDNLFGASRQELLDAMNRLEEIKREGNTSFEISTLASRPLDWTPETGNTIKLDFLAANESKFFPELQASGLLEIVESLEEVGNRPEYQNVKFGRLTTYDRKGTGPKFWPVRTKGQVKGGSTAKQGKTYTHKIHQSGGPFGPLRSAILGGLGFGPSHYSKGEHGKFASTAKALLDDWYAHNPPNSTPPDMIVQIALKAETNSLATTGTFIDFFNWLDIYLKKNPDHLALVMNKMNSLLESGAKKTKQFKLSETTATSEYYEEGSDSTYFGSKVIEAFDGNALTSIDGIEYTEDGNSIRVTNENGLTALITLFQGRGTRKGTDMSGYQPAGVAKVSNVNFQSVEALGTDVRSTILQQLTTKEMVKLTKGRWLSEEELLQIVNEDYFYEFKNKRFESKSTGKRTPLPTGTIVATLVMDPRVVVKQSSLFDLHRLGDQASGDLARFYNNASFKYATTGLKKVFVAKNTTTSIDKYGIDAGSQSSLSATLVQHTPESTPLLASRRLPGRIYVEGNSKWEKSAATPYGQQIQHVAIKFQDAFSDVLLLQQDVEVFRKSKVPESQDFEMAMDRYYGMVRNDLEMLEAQVNNIQEKMRDNGISSQDISDYLYAKHAIERNKDIFAKNGVENGSGMTDQEATDIIDRLETSAMMDVANDAYAILENTRQTLIEGGLEKRDAVDSWRQRYKNYVPLNGLAVDEMNDVSNDYPTGGAGMAIYGPSVRKARGRKSKAGHNILGNIVMQNAATHQRARKDQAMMSLYNLVKENPNSDVWNIVSPKNPLIVNGRAVSADQLKNSDNAVPIRVNGEQHFITFRDPSYARALNGMTTEKLTKIQQVVSKYVGFLRNSYTVWNPAFFIGNFYRDYESGLVNAIAEVEREGGILNGYGLDSKKFAAKLGKTAFTTLRQLFGQAAFGRDISQEMQAYMDEWSAAGGKTGWSYADSLNKVVAELNDIATRSKAGQAADKAGAFLRKFYANPKQFFEYVEAINEAFENSIRLAAYIEARRAGMTAGRAAQLSKNITVNFNKSGEYTAGINSWFLFFNASVQGTSRFARSMRANEMYVQNNQGGTTTKWHNRISTTAKISAGMTLFSAMQTLFNIAMSGEDEDGELYYNKIPDYKKERNWIIMAGPKDPIYIPLAYGLNVFHNAGMVLAEVGSGNRDVLDGAMFMALSAHSSFSPVAFGQYDDIGQNVTMAALPSVLKPMVETFVFNKTYFGGSVYREQLGIGAPVPEYQLAYRSPEYLVKLAEYLNQRSGGTSEVPGDVDVNPDKYFYLAQSLTGGAGKFVGDISNLAEGLVAVSRKNLNRAMESEDFVESLLNVEDDEMYRLKRSEIPILKLMYGEASRFYDYDLYRKNVDNIQQSVREIKKGTSTTYNLTGVAELEKILKQTEKMLDQIREYKKMAREIDDYVDRRNTLDKLQEGERLEYMLFNASYEELRGQYLD